MTKDEALKLAKELEGVIADVEEGDGFDDVCLDTVKYVRDALVMAQPEYNTTSDPCLMENAQGDLERINLVQTGVGIGKPAQQEPVAHVVIVGDMVSVSTGSNGLKELHKLGDGAPLYTAPPQPEPVIDKSAAIRIATALGWEPKRTWVGLTDEEIDTILKRGDVAEHDAWNGRWYVLPYSLTRAVEAKLKDKNNG